MRSHGRSSTWLVLLLCLAALAAPVESFASRRMLDSDSSDLGSSAAIISSDADYTSSSSVAPATSTSVTNSESSELKCKKAVAFTLTIQVANFGLGSNGHIDPVYVAVIDEFIASIIDPLNTKRKRVTATSFLGEKAPTACVCETASIDGQHMSHLTFSLFFE